LPAVVVTIDRLLNRTCARSLTRWALFVRADTALGYYFRLKPSGIILCPPNKATETHTHGINKSVSWGRGKNKNCANCRQQKKMLPLFVGIGINTFQFISDSHSAELPRNWNVRGKVVFCMQALAVMIIIISIASYDIIALRKFFSLEERKYCDN
jgi:hypothetical protein